MQLLGFTDEEATSVFGVVAAVLHLGDLQFESVGERQSALGPEAGAVRHAARLLQVPTETLVAAFTTRLMRIRGQDTTTVRVVVVVVVVVPLTGAMRWSQVTLSRDQAGNMRHAAAKFLYARLFDWLVARINRSVAPADRAAVRSSIGVLDIFGFEVFATNSFEQLCINYTVRRRGAPRVCAVCVSTPDPHCLPCRTRSSSSTSTGTRSAWRRPCTNRRGSRSSTWPTLTTSPSWT